MYLEAVSARYLRHYHLKVLIAALVLLVALPAGEAQAGATHMPARPDGANVLQSEAATSLPIASSPSAGSSPRPTVAVVLGGGAARGFSHIGLLKAFEEHGIPIDMLVGTSMGSIVAGLYASGLSVDNLMYLVTHIDMNRFFVPRIPPRGGFVHSDQFELFLDLLTNNARLEELPIPFYSIVTGVTNGQEVALDSGPIGRAIVASIAIPGVFPPVEIDGVHYVDGGLVSVVPVRAARAAGADFVIAVDVRRTMDDVDYENVVANLQLAVSLLLNKETDEQLLEADVLVTPAVGDNSSMEYDRALHFIEEGYKAALAAIDDIRAGLLELDPNFPLHAPRVQAGVDEDEFRRQVNDAIAGALAKAQRAPAVLPDLTFTEGSSPRYRVDVHVPLNWPEAVWPLFADYSLAGGAGRLYHSFGIGAGYCTSFCLTVFGLVDTVSDSLNPGVAAAGMINIAAPPTRSSAAWKARWEQTPDGKDNQWHVQLRTPAPNALTTVGSELVVTAGRDARGLFGRPSENVRGAAVLRRYFVGEPRNLMELLRGGLHWHVGGGFSAALTPDGLKLSPLVEAGVLFEGRWFGLYTTRSRLALTYETENKTWFLRLSFGD